MTTNSISDLTSRLALALDSNYDVVNMDIVLSIISTLEITTITKEQLEATRLAKYINALRRRTKSDQLARRAKSLLKKWREMVGLQQQQQPTNSSKIVNPDNRVEQPNQNSQSSSSMVDLVSENSRNVKSKPQTCILQVPDGIKPNTHTTNSGLLNSSANNKSGRSINNVYNNKQTQNKYQVSRSLQTNTGSPIKISTKQPTSFANLLTDIYNDKTVIPNSASLPHKKISTIESYNVDQSSNSNSITNGNFNSVPIVINIQDSNSGSNQMDGIMHFTEQDHRMQSVQEATNNNKSSKNSNLMFGSLLKHKKSKREKKDRRRDQRATLNENSITNMTLITDNHDTTNFISQSVQPEIKVKKFVPATEEKSHMNEPPSNISEILSLSNSSMGSMFSAEERNKSHRVSSINTCHSLTTDLTFAGKFKKQITPLSPTFNTTLSKPFDMNLYNDCRDAKVYNIPVDSERQNLNYCKFVPFRRSESNSNDNTNPTNLLSQCEVIDIISKEKLHIPKKECNTYNDNSATTNQLKMYLEDFSKPKLINSKPIQETTEVAVSISENKTPKKRGRKKGSKGVDSVIAKESSLSSQMLISTFSGSKKVKTTKELYAEMQKNRKLNATCNFSPQSQQLTSFSRPTSSCSELSINSFRALDEGSNNEHKLSPENGLSNCNADFVYTDGSDTLTTDQSQDSVPPTNEASNFRDYGDSNSNTHINYSSNINHSGEQTVCKNKSLCEIERELYELINQLPTRLSVHEIEQQCAAERIYCTCQVEEIIPEDRSQFKTSCDFDTLNSFADNVAFKKVEKQCLQKGSKVETVNILNDCGTIPNSKSNDLKPKKSIFDLDFDDDEDPLQTIKKEAIAIDYVKKENEDLSFEHIQNLSNQMTDQIKQNNDVQIQELHNETIAKNFYKVLEDPNCKAKNRFEVQTQKVTGFHINALHNCYIANINGNWDNADISFNSLDIISLKTAASQNFDDLSTLNVNNVVPKYGALVNDPIPKNLSNVKFKSIQPTSFIINTQKINKPFLGVANTFRSKITQNIKRKLKNKMKQNLHKKQIRAYPFRHFNTNVLIEDLNSSKKTDEVTNQNNDLHSNKESKIEDSPKFHIKNENTITDVKNMEEEPITFKSMASEQTSSLFGNNSASPQYNQFNKSSIDTNVPTINSKLESDQSCPLYSSKDHIINSFSSSRRSSSCSNSSLKQTQQLINLKLKRRFKRILQDQKQYRPNFECSISTETNKRKRKKKLKSSGTNFRTTHLEATRPYMKRIKIAVNGNIITEKEIKVKISKNNLKDDLVDCVSDHSDETKIGKIQNATDLKLNRNNIVSNQNSFQYDSDTCHSEDVNTSLNDQFFTCKNESNEVSKYFSFIENNEISKISGIAETEFNNHMSSTTTIGDNHIVLTIKKNLNEVNLSNNVVPINICDDKQTVLEFKKNKKVSSACDHHSKTSTNVTENLTVDSSRKNVRLNIKDKKFVQKLSSKRKLRKKIKCLRTSSKYSTQSIKHKKHHQLFHPFELYECDSNGELLKILNISSCSSSCAEEIDSEIEKLPATRKKSVITNSKENYDLSKTILKSESDANSITESFIGSDITATDTDEDIDYINTRYTKNKTIKCKNKMDECNLVCTCSLQNISSAIQENMNSELPVENNGLLSTFNNIYYNDAGEKTVNSLDNELVINNSKSIILQETQLQKKLQQLQPPNEYCDVFNKNFNNNNNHLSEYSSNNRSNSTDSLSVKYNIDYKNCKNRLNVSNNLTNNSSSNIDFQLSYSNKNNKKIENELKHNTQRVQPYKEYYTGIRAVDEDVNDELGNNCARFQQFKEWHEVCQLRSYNDELLTVLPYVVLE